jgi:thermolysin
MRRVAVPLAAVLLGGVLLAQAPPEPPRLRAATTTLALSGDAAGTWDRRIAAMIRSGALRLVSSTEDTMLAGRVHDRYDQYAGEARIVGAQVLRQRSADGVETVFGGLHPEAAGIDPTPSLTAEDAAGRVRALTGRDPLGGHLPELVVLPLGDGSYRLTWLAHAVVDADAIALFLDARTGEEVRRFSIVETQAASTAAVGSGTGVLGDRKKLSVSRQGGVFVASDMLRAAALVTYDLRGDYLRANGIVFGNQPVSTADIASDTDNLWDDGVAVDAHSGIGFAYDYFYARFNRRGIDGSNRLLRAVVHPVRREDIPRLPPNVFQNYVVNAFWCGFFCGPDGFGILVLGEGLQPPSNLTYYAAGFDIVAHEYTHAVTSYSSDLIYLDESGALNESFSDIMAVGAEHYAVATGRRNRPANYLIGEDVMTAAIPGQGDGFRSLANPGAHAQPDHYSRRTVGQITDNGAVHTNSGIPNHAFYLAIEGGTNRTSGIAVQGVGGANREQIERVFYRGFTTYLSHFPTFADARRATLQAAGDLYGESSAAYRAVRDAWTAVGVD